MPVNKAARVRHEIIDECLRTTTKKWTKQSLLERLNQRLSLHYGEEKAVSLSQLRYDLEDMQAEYGAPVESVREGKKVFYFYEDAGFSIVNTPVSDGDIEKLKQAVSLLQQLKGFTISDEVSELVQRLERKVQFSSEEAPSIIQFEKPAIAYGIEYLEDLYHAIKNKTVLKLSYQSFKQPIAQLWTIHPYLLKEYNKRWYLLGLFETTNTIGIYALDRIKEITVCNHAYKENTLLDPESYFFNVIGVTIPVNRTIEKIILNVSHSRAPYIFSKPIHHSQQIVDIKSDGTATIELSLMINTELINHLLSFGPDVQVMAPDSLVQIIKSQVQQMYTNLFD